MVETLDKLGYEVKGSKSAIDVAELVNSGKFDMCILDIHMGDGQDNAGLKVLEKVRRTRRSCLTGVMSAYTEKLELAENIGADGFAKKTTDVKWDTWKLVNGILNARIWELSTKASRFEQDLKARRTGWWWGRGASSFGFLNVVVGLVCLVLLVVISVKIMVGAGSDVPSELLFSFSTAFGWVGNAYLTYRASQRVQK